MHSKKKKAHELTDKEAAKRLFPKEVRRELKKEPHKIRPLFPKPKPKRKS